MAAGHSLQAPGEGNSPAVICSNCHRLQRSKLPQHLEGTYVLAIIAIIRGIVKFTVSCYTESHHGYVFVHSYNPPVPSYKRRIFSCRARI